MVRQELMEDRQQSDTPMGDFAVLQCDAHERVAEVEQEILAEELNRLDVDVPVVLIEGTPHRRVLRREETYVTVAGSICV